MDTVGQYFWISLFDPPMKRLQLGRIVIHWFKQILLHRFVIFSVPAGGTAIPQETLGAEAISWEKLKNDISRGKVRDFPRGPIRCDKQVAGAFGIWLPWWPWNENDKGGQLWTFRTDASALMGAFPRSSGISNTGLASAQRTWDYWEVCKTEQTLVRTWWWSVRARCVT